MFFVPAIAGMFIGGNGLGLIGYFAYWIVFFGLWENRVLCSHCPFYAEQGGQGHVLHCYANYGLYKLWPYDPRPMSSSHKVQFLIALGVFVGYPLPFLITSVQYFYLSITLIGIVAWLTILKLRICPKCLNFSCPFNSVPKNVVDDFLKHNPVMRKAWEECGYIIN